jgi:hypothetical protein
VDSVTAVVVVSPASSPPHAARMRADMASAEKSFIFDFIVVPFLRFKGLSEPTSQTDEAAAGGIV